MFILHFTFPKNHAKIHNIFCIRKRMREFFEDFVRLSHWGCKIPLSKKGTIQQKWQKM